VVIIVSRESASLLGRGGKVRVSRYVGVRICRTQEPGVCSWSSEDRAPAAVVTSTCA
jgi:hypothetical protein